MIAWWWVLVAFVIGEMAGIAAISVCAANERKKGGDSE